MAPFIRPRQRDALALLGWTNEGALSRWNGRHGPRLRERKEQDPYRDYGLYLDTGWRPTWPATVVDWKDFGLPSTYETAAQQIQDGFRQAQDGQQVEVGCKGGYGRTGTVLACMAILAGVPPGDAAKWVRANYRAGAVETRDQEWWIQWFHGHVHGLDVPPRPRST
jgi:hypothetical protein